MKTYKPYLIGAGVMLALLIALYFIFRPKTERPKPESTPAIEISLLQDLSTFKSKEIIYKANIKRDSIEIDRLKNKGIPTVNQNWNHATSNFKRLTTDQRMLMLQDYLESPDRLQKLLIDKDTLIGFTLNQFAEVGNMMINEEYQGIMIDSLQGLCEYYELSQEQYQKLVDNLNLQNANAENRIALKQDQLTSANATIDQDKKDLKKAKRRNFFSGLGIGIATGAAGILTLILAL